ncbi:MAG: hypothetical protein IT559_05565 [Alphaproteobacteria bacterium]|nr:hypothetical protein [Alphaproteobacteria bacterium]
MGLINNVLGTIGVVFGVAAVGDGMLRTLDEPRENRNIEVFATHTIQAAGDIASGAVKGIIFAVDDATKDFENKAPEGPNSP